MAILEKMLITQFQNLKTVLKILKEIFLNLSGQIKKVTFLFFEKKNAYQIVFLYETCMISILRSKKSSQIINPHKVFG